MIFAKNSKAIDKWICMIDFLCLVSAKVILYFSKFRPSNKKILQTGFLENQDDGSRITGCGVKDHFKNKLKAITMIDCTIVRQRRTLNHFNPKIKIKILICCPATFPIKLLKYQANSPCVILSLIFVTTLSYKALILQGEI